MHWEWFIAGVITGLVIASIGTLAIAVCMVSKDPEVTKYS